MVEFIQGNSEDDAIAGGLFIWRPNLAKEQLSLSDCMAYRSAFLKAKVTGNLTG
jgi:hypothetical protein